MIKTQIAPESTSINRVAPQKAMRRFVDAFEELLESLEYASPKFLEELKASRQSGLVSAKEIEQRLGIK